MKTREELQEEFDSLNDLIAELQDKIDNFAINPNGFEEQYNELLDDLYPEIFNLQPSRILKECDPIQYQCGLNDYVDGIDLIESEEYNELVKELETLQSELEDLQNEMEGEE